MMGILARMRGKSTRDPAVDRSAVDGLGTSALALRLDGARLAPLPPLAALVETADGVRWAVHAAPLRCFLTPFAAAPEIGLRLDYCFDASGDRQRFALLLAAEAESVLPTAAVGAALQDAVQAALQLGTLELPPCTTDDEWHAFRAGLNELVYTRFGLVVEDCLPVDLHPATDLAAQLAAAAGAIPTPRPREPDTGAGGNAEVHAELAAMTAAAAPGACSEAAEDAAEDANPGGPGRDDGTPLRWARLEDMPWHGRRAAAAAASIAAGGDPAQRDVAALRRLFLELPALAAGLRALPMQEGDGTFAPLQDILRRLAHAALNANTMPSLTQAAPGQRLPKNTQKLRAMHTQSAQAALDEGWALLAAMRNGLDPARLDETDRMLSNLEYSLAQRRAIEP
ncbi:hypothetical protein ABT364_07345 [Massilia sp. SR12]